MDDEHIARSLGGGPADIPGLWWVPGFPELTTGQLRSIAPQRGPAEQFTRAVANIALR